MVTPENTERPALYDYMAPIVREINALLAPDLSPETVDYVVCPVVAEFTRFMSDTTLHHLALHVERMYGGGYASHLIAQIVSDIRGFLDMDPDAEEKR